MRGFLGGAVWGLVVAVAGLSVASLMAPQPAGNRPPEAPQVEPPAAVAETGAGEVTAGAEPLAPEGAGPAVAEVGAPPAPAEGPELPVADRAPAEAPDLELAAEGLAAAPEMTEAAAVEVGGGGGAVAEAVPAPAPVLPAPEVDVAAATEPAEPRSAPVEAEVPEAPEVAMEAPGLAAETAPETGPALAEEAPGERLPVAVPAAPEQPEAGDAAAAGPEVAVAIAPVVAGEVAGIAPPAAAEVAPVVQAEVQEADVGGPDDGAADTSVLPVEGAGIAPPAVEAGPDGDAEAEAEPRAFSLPQVGVEREDAAPEAAEAAGEEVAGEGDLPGQNGEAALPGDRSGIRVNRPAADGTEQVEAPVVAALADFGAAWDGGAGLPRMGIVLVDDGALPGAVAAVAALPMPVTVALDPGAAGAAETMAAYRAAGIEVLALARLPLGAMPVDVAVTYEAVFAILPEAVGMIDLGEGGLQAQSAVTEQAMAQLATAGRGAVLQGGGLNMAARLAEEAGVPVAVIDRRLDAGGAEAAAIRRTLDQAAFRARQGTEVVLVGGVDAETISALMLWGAARAAAQVDVAPVSVLMQGG